MNNYLCVDIGGTTIKSGIYDENGQVVLTYPLSETNNSVAELNIVTRLNYLVEKSIKDYPLAGVCISTAGVVNPETGEVIYAGYTIPNYSNTPLKEIIESNFQIPCEVENDVNAACLGEKWRGSLQGIDDAICLTVGTGIGGAILQGGCIQHGVGFTAGEVGYLQIDGENYQDIASTSALIKKVARLKNKQYDGKQIFEMALNGDTECIQAIDELVTGLTTGLVNIIYLLNPEAIVLGGGIMSQQAYLEPLILKKIAAKIEDKRFNQTKITFAALKNDAGMIGALYNFKKRQ